MEKAQPLALGRSRATGEEGLDTTTTTVLRTKSVLKSLRHKLLLEGPLMVERSRGLRNVSPNV